MITTTPQPAQADLQPERQPTVPRSRHCVGRCYRDALALEAVGEQTILGPVPVHIHWYASTRHKAGAFYTPYHLVHFTVKQSLGPTILHLIERAKTAVSEGDRAKLQSVITSAQRLRVADPACGCGRFLLVAFRMLRDLHVWLLLQETKIVRADQHRPRTSGHSNRTYHRSNTWTIGAKRALACLQGYDLNPEAVKTARRVLLLAAGLANQAHRVELTDSAFPVSVANPADLSESESLLSGLQVADTLADALQTDDHRLVSPAHTGCPADPTWHIVIGNPPWGAKGVNLALARQMDLPAVNTNTFSLFLLTCLERLAPGGRLGFVLPRNFCKGNDYAQIRSRLLQMAHLEWLVDAGRAFPGVTQEAVVIIVRRLKSSLPEAVTKIARISPEATNAKVLHQIKQAAFRQTPGNVLTINAGVRSLRIAAQMERVAGTSILRQWVSWARGLEYGGNGALVHCSQCGLYTSLPKKKQAVKRCVGCGAVISSYIATYSLISKSADHRHTVPIYVGRHVRRYQLAAPHWADPAVPGVRYKKADVFTGPKILLPKIAPFLAGALDNSAAWTTQGVYILRARYNTWDTAALLGLLNSAPLRFYYQCRYNDEATLTTNVTLTNLLRLPVPPVDAILLSTVREGALKLMQNTPAQADICREDDAAIDEAVCRMYGLSAADAAYLQAWRDEHCPA